MARTKVTGAKGKVVGEIDDQPNQSIAYDEKGRRMGRFDKKSNMTYDATGKDIGKGNQLKKLYEGK